jgi:hypothetical protein
MSHYDYLSPHMAGLAGPVEDLAAVAVKSVAERVGKNREAAWNYFRFGIPDISASAAEGRIKGWTNLTLPFKAAMDALKPFMFPLAIITDLKDFKLEDRLRLQADLKSKFDAEWAKAFPTAAAPAAAPASPFSRTGMFAVSRLPTGPLAPAGAGASSAGSSSTGATEKKFPVVPVAIGATVLAALLLLKRK